MKRLILPLMLLCLLLCGCGKKNVQDHMHDDSVPAIQPTEPEGCYIPDSETEHTTGGAVRLYAMDADVYAVNAMGEDLLVFSGSDATVLSRRSGENLYLTATATLDTFVDANDPALQVSDRGVVYFCAETGELVILDTALRETARIELPEDLVGTPVLSADRNYVYYCTGQGLRQLDLEEDISRLVKELNYREQSVAGLVLEETVIRVLVKDEYGKEFDLYCSAETGQTLHSGTNLAVTTVENRYFAAIPGDVLPSYVFGTAGETPRMVTPDPVDAAGVFLEARMQFVSVDSGQETALALYDLDSGKRISEIAISSGVVQCVETRFGTDQLYILCRQQDGSVWLYRWDTKATQVTDAAVSIGEYFHAGNPDTAGLAQCRVLADEIGNRHGVRILFGEDAVAEQPWDYHLQPQYQVPVLMQCLNELDRLLAGYPQGFLTAAAEGTGDVITICLVGQITGSPESGSLSSVEGLQFRSGNRMMIALTVGTDLQKNLYHQMYYAIETRLLSSSNDCYQWDKLNPKKFSYDYDWEKNAARSKEQYLTEDSRYFIDVESMFSPSVDRATIMEYAMAPGNEAFFRSEYMQKKLKTLCTGIRESFGMKQSPESFLWEQYLEESLADTL